MSDPAPLARIANASARRNLLSLLGSQLRAADHAEADHQAQSCNFSTLVHEEKQDLNGVWKEIINDSAGVGAIAISDKQDGRMPKFMGHNQQGFENDELLRKQLLGSVSKSRHNGSQHRIANGKLDSRSLHIGTRNRNDEVSSEEEQGRSGLGISSKQRNANKSGRPNKKAKIEVETFESMQSEGSSLKEDGSPINEETEPVVTLPAKRASEKPKSYLDQVLEAKRSKQQKKMKKKQKLKSDV